ncbi:acyltransferase [Hymenobacter sp. 15J16-1T3B]|uniref:acyltransferase family protein n=1 Tax=Hymenobacter sp. 15J16-1T3B TaxID=2886941 RepID=UPI001D11E582|nr:acyltransferase [Hymenobacter sp. 15J16-1T3B]MCC3157501.1 acyltransferase [Hymenobacter sp. 15J16-1T3B]
MQQPQLDQPVVLPAGSSVTKAKPKKYYPALTGIRALAAYMVFFHHFNPLRTNDVSVNFLGDIVQEFHIGVTIFFVLSGFLITARYIDRITISTKWFINYMRNRVARIYPLYFLLTICTFIVSALHLQPNASDGWPTYSRAAKILVPIFNITFIRGFFIDIKASGIKQGWSLTVEECFYIAAPFLLLWLARNRKSIFFFPFLIALPGLLLVALIGSPDRFSGFFGDYRFLFNYTFFGRCVEFVCGMGLALIVNKYTYQQRLNGLFTALGFGWILLCLIGLALIQSPVDGSGWFNYTTIAINNLILPIGVAATFYGLVYERTWISRLFESKTFDLLGKSSYAFYLVHMGIFSNFIEDHITTNYYIMFLLLNVVSIALYYFIEKPAQKLIAKS